MRKCGYKCAAKFSIKIFVIWKKITVFSKCFKKKLLKKKSTVVKRKIKEETKEKKCQAAKGSKK